MSAIAVASKCQEEIDFDTDISTCSVCTIKSGICVLACVSLATRRTLAFLAVMLAQHTSLPARLQVHEAAE